MGLRLVERDKMMEYCTPIRSEDSEVKLSLRSGLRVVERNKMRILSNTPIPAKSRRCVQEDTAERATVYGTT